MVLKQKKTYGYAKLIKILEPSQNRVNAVCPVFGRCGGCTLQHMRYDAQLQYKTEKVLNCIKRIGGLANVPVNDTLGMDSPFFYRNKAQFPVAEQNGLPTIGFFAPRSHRLVPVTNCALQHAVSVPILEAIERFMRRYGIPAYNEENHMGLVRHVVIKVGFATGEVMVCLVLNGDTLPHADELRRELSAIDGMTSVVLNINRERTNVIMGEENLTKWGKDFITDTLCGLRFSISPLSFFQVNPVQTEVLYKCALEFAQPGKDDVIADIYCGVGTISLFMAQYAKKVCGIEYVPEAIADANENAQLNGIKNAEFFTGDAALILPQLLEKGLNPSIIVLDPPRKGCAEEVLHAIINAAPHRIVYVSCDPATLARDLKLLVEDGVYEITRVQPVDCFPMTSHIETVVLLEKNAEIL